MTTLAAILCIIIGIAIAAFDGNFLFPPLVWFVLAIAFDLLPYPVVFGPVVRREPRS